MKKFYTTLIIMLLIAHTAMAQSDFPKIFINCLNGNCDLDFMRSELENFNFVRDRLLSNIEIIVIEQDNSSGGKKITVSFIGRASFSGKEDVVTFSVLPSETADQIRNRLLNSIKIGLITFLKNTPAQDRISVNFEDVEAASSAVYDKWNYWVIEPGISGTAEGGSNNFTADIHAGGTINRITDQSKFLVAAGYDFGYNRYKLDGEKIAGQWKSYDAVFFYVKSLNSHWSAGGLYGLEHNSFENIKLLHKAALALEFNIFPYEQNTRRQVRFIYQLGGTNFRYLDTTVFDKTKETRAYNRLSAITELNRSWGTVNLFVHGQFFLDKPEQHHAGGGAAIKLRLFKGLSFITSGEWYYIKDQVSLLKNNLDDNDYLLGAQQLPTNFNFTFECGITYTFGSIYNNVVNPRFNGMF